MKLIIQNREISDQKSPFIIGEISANHGGSIKNILKLLEAAADIGLEAVKIQTFKPNEMTLDYNKREFSIKNKFSDKNWNNRSLYSIYKEAYLPFEWHKEIFDKAKSLGLIIFSSAFDNQSVEFLSKLKTPAYKIASLESLHFPLIEEILKKKKPLIISTGTLNFKETQEIKKFLKKKKFNNYALLHCVTQYPAKYENLNLKKIILLKRKIHPIVGFSDHTSNDTAAISAVTLGANIIEKHFKLTSKDKTLDAKFSITPKEMKNLIKKCKEAWESLGNQDHKISTDELIYKNYRRSIYVSKDIERGELITKNNIKVIRPGFGLEPKYFKKVIGKKSRRKLKFATPLKTNMIKI